MLYQSGDITDSTRDVICSKVHKGRELVCRDRKIAVAQGEAYEQPNAVRGVYLLFVSGKRPDTPAIRAFVRANSAISLTHDPAAVQMLRVVRSDDEIVQPPTGAAAPGWVELLRDGLTFDLEGLCPADPIEFPASQHGFDFEGNPSSSMYEALRLVPGAHLAGGESSLPVVRGMIALARDLTHHFQDVEAIIWPPAQSVVGRRYFESTTTAWIDGGAFPALGLTAFVQTLDGALQSVGLDYFIGQELRIEPPLVEDKVAATRLAVRLVNQLVLMGGVQDAERVVAPDGTRLIMRHSRNGRFVRVWSE